MGWCLSSLLPQHFYFLLLLLTSAVLVGPLAKGQSDTVLVEEAGNLAKILFKSYIYIAHIGSYGPEIIPHTLYFRHSRGELSLYSFLHFH